MAHHTLSFILLPLSFLTRLFFYQHSHSQGRASLALSRQSYACQDSYAGEADECEYLLK